MTDTDRTVVGGVQIPRREKWIKLTDEYAGMQFRAWINAPSRLWTAINQAGQGQAEGDAQAAIEQIVLEHNGWLDFDGEPYPAANTRAFWDEIPTELGALIIVAVRQEQAVLPNSIAARRRR